MNFLMDWSEFWSRENWLHIIEVIRDFFNRPIPVIGVTIGSLTAIIFSIVWFIFKNTSFGKKAIRELKNGYNSLKNGYETFKSDTIKSYEGMKSFYEDALNKAEAQLNENNSFIALIAENSHNQKIKEGYELHKQKLSLINTNYDEFLKNKEIEIRKQVEQEYESKYRGELETLKEDIKALKELVKPVEEIAKEDLEVNDDGGQNE